MSMPVTVNNIRGNQFIIGSSNQLPEASSLSFNDAPLDSLSVPFIGREKELSYLSQVLDVVHGNMPTRCVVHGMQGLGKSQLALQMAKLSFDSQRYSVIFWISATTVEKLNQGFAKLLDLIGHPDRFHPEQSTKLTV